MTSDTVAPAKDVRYVRLCLIRAEREARYSVRYSLNVNNRLDEANSYNALSVKLSNVRNLNDVVLFNEEQLVLEKAIALASSDEDIMSLHTMEKIRRRRVKKTFAKCNNDIQCDVEYSLSRLQGRQLILDMDDTLISNSKFFTESEISIVNLMKEVNPKLSRQKIVDELHNIDRKLLPVYGYTPRRWYEVAKKLAVWTAGGNDNEVISRALEAADIAMELGEILPGVEETLRLLQQAGVPMVIKTKGDLSKQTEKLEAHRFDRFVGDNIIIVDRKTKDTFIETACRFNMKNVVSIGDSGPSDITPALQAGFDAVHLVAKNKLLSAPEAAVHNLEAPIVESFPDAIKLLTTIK